MNREPVLIRAAARILGLVASCLWKASSVPDLASEHLDRAASRLNDAGFKVNDAGIGLLERYIPPRPYVLVAWNLGEPQPPEGANR